MEGKQKMSQKLFMLIMIPVLVILLGTVIAVTAVMNYFKVTMDVYLGRGELHLVPLEGTENWNTDYYGTKMSTAASKDAAVKVSRKISDEGIILLKNNGTLPVTATSKVTALGRTVIDPVYGGSGSGNVDATQDYIITCVEALTDTFGENLNTAVISRMESLFANDTSNKYKKAEIAMDDMSSDFYGIGEFYGEDYRAMDAIVSGYTDAMLVFIGRAGGEGGDLTQDMSLNNSGGSSDEHQLELNEHEKAMISYAKSKSDKVIVVLNMSTTLELGALETDGEIDAVVWMGSPGAVGFGSMTNVITGKVNPSGRTVDTFVADFETDPTWVNFGDFQYDYNGAPKSHPGAGTDQVSYVEYEEGIYVGYRYYETAAAVKGDSWYNEWKKSADKATGTGVVYPFGYGKSYTTFTQKITSSDYSGDKVRLSVEVENTGTVKGKEVVQVYYTAPYLGNIEKAHVNLVAFAKTDVLEPAGKETVKIEFLKEDMASYDYKSAKAYVLDAGEYEIKLMKNSHEVWDSFKFSLDSKTVYGADNPRQSEKTAQSYMNADGTLEDYSAKKLADPEADYIAAVNRFEDLNSYMSNSDMANLSRNDFDGTSPTRGVAKKAASQTVKDTLAEFEYATDALLGNVATSRIYESEAPVSGDDNNLSLIDVRGLNYYDEKWDLLLDQLTYSKEEFKILTGGTYNTRILEVLGKPITADQDGPAGLRPSFNSAVEYNACAWCSEPLLAATFNVDLAYEMGETVGQEALALGISGWYAPAMNIHRSQFAGRNFEYYSEDSFLSGKMAAAVVSGAGKSGLYAYVKHFVLNDQEINRCFNLCTWVNEQALREIYLKPFEICIKEAICSISYISDDQGNWSTSTMRAATGVMSSFNRIGAVMVSESYALLTEVLRDEWGFNGMIITDMMNGSNEDKKLRAGNDLNMAFNDDSGVADQQSATAKHAFRKAVKNICYTVVNSNAMVGFAPGTIFYYDMSPWAIWLLVGNIIVYALIIAGAVWIVFRSLHAKKNPEKYKR